MENTTEKKVVWYIWLDANGLELDRKVKGRGRQFKEAVQRADGNWYIVLKDQFSSHSLAVETVAANFVASLGFAEMSITPVSIADASFAHEDAFKMFDEMHINLPECKEVELAVIN